MSQAGIVDFIGTHPEIPTMFVANVGTAVPIANTIELLGAAVAAHGVPLQTVASGNTVDFNIQYASAAASSVAGNAGVASFSSTEFTVDANGYVTLSSSVGQTDFTVDAFTAPGTNPVVPNGSDIVTVTGGQVAAGTTTNVIRTNSLAANTYTIQIQRSQAVGSSTVGDNGVSHFNSAYFTVDANGFVSISGTAIGQTITGNSGGALSPTAGNWNILGAGSLTTAGSGSTLTIQLTGITNHAVQVGGASTTLTQVGPSATAGSVLASNGAAADPSFQTISSLGAILTITGNSGGAEVPLAGNFNILGAGSITVAGSANTETVQLTGLTNHNVLVGAGTSTITNVAPSATSGVPLISNGASADPSFGTAVVAGGGTGNTTFTAYSVICAGTTATGAFQNVSGLGSAGNVLTSNGAGALPSWQAAAASGIVTINGDSGSVTGATVTFTGTGSGLTFSGASTTMTLGGTLVVSHGGTGVASTTAYGVICGGTTSTGSFQNAGAGTSGQVLVSNGASALPSWSSSGASKLVLISSQSASSSASISFTGLNAYSSYLLIVDNCQPATNTAFLEMLVSQNNGSSYLSTSYAAGVNYNAYNSTTTTNANSTTYMPLTGPMANTAIMGGTFNIHNLNIGNGMCLDGNASWNDTTLATIAFGRAGGQSASGINAVQLKMSSGNITAGNFTLYGYATS